MSFALKLAIREAGCDAVVLNETEAKTLEAHRRDKAGKWQHERVSERIKFSVCDDCTIQLDRAALFTK